MINRPTDQRLPCPEGRAAVFSERFQAPLLLPVGGRCRVAAMAACSSKRTQRFLHRLLLLALFLIPCTL